MSPFKYGYEILAVNEYTGLDLYCTAGQYVGNGVCPVTQGSQVLDTLGFQQSYLQRGFWVLFGLFIGFRIIAFFILKTQANKKVL